MLKLRTEIVPQAIGVILRQSPELTPEQVRFALYLADRECWVSRGSPILGGVYIVTPAGPQHRDIVDLSPERDSAAWLDLSDHCVEKLIEASKMANIRGWRQLSTSYDEYKMCQETGLTEIPVEKMLFCDGWNQFDIDQLMSSLKVQRPNG